MQERIRNDLFAMLRGAVTAIKAKNYGALAELSNHSIHNASIYRDEDSLSTAVLLYTLAKILARSAPLPSGAKFCDSIEAELGKALQTLEGNAEGKYHEQLRHLFSHITQMDSKLKLYITEVITQAQIKKGSKLYEHGFSLAHAAAMLGITQWELQSYIGHTTIADMEEGADIRSRISFARTLFNHG